MKLCKNIVSMGTAVSQHFLTVYHEQDRQEGGAKLSRGNKTRAVHWYSWGNKRKYKGFMKVICLVKCWIKTWWLWDMSQRLTNIIYLCMATDESLISV